MPCKYSKYNQIQKLWIIISIIYLFIIIYIFFIIMFLNSFWFMHIMVLCYIFCCLMNVYCII